MKKKSKDIRYTIPNRLTDVIRLISVLSLDKHTFRTKEGLDKSIRGKPLSAKDWIEIAREHAEFFRPNGDDFYIALLLRSFLQEIELEEGLKTRETLSLSETQKLIDAAISLHDKEIARIQKNSFRIPIITAVIAGSAIVLASLITTSATIISNNSTNNKIDSVKTSLHRIEIEIIKNQEKSN